MNALIGLEDKSQLVLSSVAATSLRCLAERRVTRTAGAPMSCRRSSRFWGLAMSKIFHEIEDSLVYGFI